MIRAAVAALGLVLLTGCQVTVALGIDLDDDGSGEVRTVVTLDEEAAARAPDLEVSADDLVAAGWTVEGPTTGTDGTVTITAEKPFSTPDEAEALVKEVSGDTGPFREFRLSHDSSFLQTESGFTGTVDLTAGIEGFSDEELTQRLGSPLGVDRSQLDVVNEAFDIRVQVQLPGEITSNAPVEADNGALWRPQLGERVELRAGAERWNVSRITFGAVAVVAAGALVVLVVRRRRSGGFL